MKLIYSSVFIILSIAISAYGQTLELIQPEDVGISSARLERLNSTINEHLKKGELPGAVTMIGRCGKIAHLESFGMINISNEIPMQNDAIFRLASMSKLLTSIAVMILYEEGNFFLTDPVYKFIPELKDMEVAVFDCKGNIIKTEPARNHITIQQLLTHSAGFTYGSNGTELDSLYAHAGLEMFDINLSDNGLQSFIKKIAGVPLAFHPGTQWGYGFSIDVLGYLVEVVSGKKLNQFCKERIFEPLGMTDTDFYVPAEKMNRFTTLYEYKANKLKAVDSPGDTLFGELPDACSGGGGVCSTILDYAAIGQMLLNGGSYNGVQLLGKKTVELMMTNHLTGIPKDKWFEPYAGFGFGGAVIDDVGRYGEYASKGYFWWAGIFNTYFFVDPVEDMFGIIMFQVSPFTHLDLMKRFKNLVYQSLIY